MLRQPLHNQLEPDYVGIICSNFKTATDHLTSFVFNEVHEVGVCAGFRQCWFTPNLHNNPLLQERESAGHMVSERIVLCYDFNGSLDQFITQLN